MNPVAFCREVDGCVPQIDGANIEGSKCTQLACIGKTVTVGIEPNSELGPDCITGIDNSVIVEVIGDQFSKA